MALTVPCPNPDCGKAIAVPDGQRGKAARCPHCHTRLPAAAAPVPPEVLGAMPAAVGRFEVRGRLGAGAFATVYRAYDPLLERDVAVKVPQADALGGPVQLQRFLREAKAAAKLRHPHIVPVHETGFDGTHHYIVSAFIEGRTLSGLLDQGRLDFRLAARLARDLADAAAYAHELGIVHRDIKPANVLLDGRREPHLADFGLAHVEDAATPLTRLGSVVGTPAYIAPELAAGHRGQCAPTADQYSLGVVLYEMLCGHPPFEGPKEVVLFHAVRTAPPPPRTVVPDVPPELEAICLRALRKRPEERFADCGELADALGAWLEQAAVRPRPAVPVQAPRRGASPWPAVTLATATDRPHASITKPPASPWPAVTLVTGLCVLAAAVVWGVVTLATLGGREAPARPEPVGPEGEAKLEKKERPAAKKGEQFPADKEKQPLVKEKEKAAEADGGLKGDKDGVKEGKAGGEEKKLPELPPKMEEVPQGPPSAKEVVIGRFLPPVPVPLLLQYDPARSRWERLERQIKATPVWTARLLVSLPGFRSPVLTDSGVRLTLAGTIPEFGSAVPVIESLVTLHAHDQLDLDLTLHRGRILLSNTRADRPVRVRVRFENPTIPTQPEIWDLKLEGQDAEVLLDRFAFFDFDEPFFDDPKHPDRKGPTSQVGLIVLHGTATVRLGDVTHALTAPPGAALMGWNSRSGPRGPERLDKVPDWTGPNSPTPKGGEELRADMRRAATMLNVNLTGLEVEAGLRKSLASAEPAVRKLTVRCFAALDMVPQLVNLLEDKDRSDVRLAAIEALRHWAASGRDNDYALLAALKEHYTRIEAERIVARLHYFPGAALRQPETYGTLIDELQSKRLAVRELAAWHLYQLVPEARKTIPFDAARLDAVGQVDAQWRALAKSWPGGIPPRFAKKAEMK